MMRSNDHLKRDFGVACLVTNSIKKTQEVYKLLVSFYVDWTSDNHWLCQLNTKGQTPLDQRLSLFFMIIVYAWFIHHWSDAFSSLFMNNQFVSLFSLHLCNLHKCKLHKSSVYLFNSKQVYELTIKLVYLWDVFRCCIQYARISYACILYACIHLKSYIFEHNFKKLAYIYIIINVSKLDWWWLISWKWGDAYGFGFCS